MKLIGIGVAITIAAFTIVLVILNKFFVPDLKKEYSIK